MSTQALYHVGLYPRNSHPNPDPAYLDAVRDTVGDINEIARNAGFGEVYYYTRDEPSADTVCTERPVWEAIRDAAGKVFSGGAEGLSEITYPANKRACLTFDESVGVFAEDVTVLSSGVSNPKLIRRNNHGELLDMDTNTCWVTGQIGGALAFDGVNDRVVVDQSVDLVYTGNAFSVSAWVNRDIAETNGGFLLSKPWNDSGEYNYCLGVDTGGLLTVTVGGATEWSSNTTAILPAGAWTHVVMTIDTNRNVALYRNGVATLNTQHSVTDWTPASGDEELGLAIGCHFPHASSWVGDSANSFKGEIDQVELFAGWLGSSAIDNVNEIAFMFNDGLAGTLVSVGDLKDLHISENATEAESALVHSVSGHQIFTYTDPWGMIEMPEIYRRGMGLRLWGLDLDGTCTWVWQGSANHTWNDFDYSSTRDFNMTYATTNGVIDTIQWEGYREGIDDLRYLATLEYLLGFVSPFSQARQDAEAYLDWLKDADRLNYVDQDEVRDRMVDHILALQATRRAAATLYNFQ